MDFNSRSKSESCQGVGACFALPPPLEICPRCGVTDGAPGVGSHEVEFLKRGSEPRGSEGIQCGVLSLGDQLDDVGDEVLAVPSRRPAVRS